MKTNNNLSEVSGNHYEMFEIEPVTVIRVYNLNWFQGETIKYISRHWYKNGKTDIEKALHILSMASELKPISIYNSLDSMDKDSLIEEYVHQFYDKGLLKEFGDKNKVGYFWVGCLFFTLQGEYLKAYESLDHYKSLYYDLMDELNKIKTNEKENPTD